MDKEKFSIEFPINSSKGVLYNCFSTPSGLAEWFCDDVNIKKDVHTFIWDGSEEKAKLLQKTNGEKIKFQWTDDETTNYFIEFRIQFDEITKDVSLIVTDFAEDEDEVEESKLLWTNHISDLKMVLGST